jgi:hypothetical protein
VLCDSSLLKEELNRVLYLNEQKINNQEEQNNEKVSLFLCAVTQLHIRIHRMYHLKIEKSYESIKIVQNVLGNARIIVFLRPDT